MAGRAQKLSDNAPLVPSLVTTLLQKYGVGSFMKDLSAGITVGVVALPLALAFAIASGVTPERGLYTSIVAGFVMALLSGSRFQVSGPTGAFVVIIYSVVSRHGYDGLVLTTLLAGLMLVIFGMLRLGSVIKFIPFPVTTGFTAGIALLIFSSQMKDFFGLPMADTPPEFFDKWHMYVSNAAGFSPATVGVALFTLCVILGIRKFAPRIPAPVIGVAAATFLAWYFQLPVDTIGSRFGSLPQGLPSFVHPPDLSFDRIRLLLPDALTIALLAGIESLLSCVVADSMSGDRHNSNMELVAQGVGNVASVLFGGISATGAIARTATNVRAGAVSPVAGIIHTVVIVVFIVWLMPVAEAIPLAALAAVLVVVASDMSDLRTVRHMFQGPKSDWSVMLLTFGLTVVLDLTVAVYMGVVLASLLFMRRMSELTQISTSTADEAAEDSELAQPLRDEDVPDGVQVFGINGPLFFGVADRFQATLDAMAGAPKVIILYLHNVPTIDMTGIHTLEAFVKRRSGRYEVLFADVPARTMATLERVGLIRAVGKGNVCPTLHDALERARSLVAS